MLSFYRSLLLSLLCILVAAASVQAGAYAPDVHCLLFCDDCSALFRFALSSPG